MPTPSLAIQIAKQTIKAVEDALRKGYRPPGLSGKEPGAIGAASEALGIPRNTLFGRLQLIDRTYKLKPNWKLYKAPAVKKIAEKEVKDRGLEERIKDLSKRLDFSQKAEAATQRTLEAVLGIKNEISNEPLWVSAPSSKRGLPGVPCTIWSDWQYGEVVDKAEVGGINEYDSKIAARRIKSLVSRTVELCFTHMAEPSYPGVVVMLGGDMISGGIHPELMDTDDRTAPESVIELFGHIRTALLEMKKHFKLVYVPCVVGNHGRTTIKIRHKGRVRYSYEFVLYRFLRESFADDPAVRFYIPLEIDAYFKVYGHRYRLTHGDSLGTKGGDGIIGIYGKVRRGEIKIRNAEAPIGRDHDTLVMGHFHQYFALPDLIVNPTIVGFSEYAKSELRAKAEPPAQALWFTHPKYGAIWPNRVFVEEVGPRKPEVWVSWKDQA